MLFLCIVYVNRNKVKGTVKKKKKKKKKKKNHDKHPDSTAAIHCTSSWCMTKKLLQVTGTCIWLVHYSVFKAAPVFLLTDKPIAEFDKRAFKQEQFCARFM